MWQPTYTTYYDTGTVSVTVNGVTKTVNYDSGSNTETVAGQIARAFNQDGSSPVGMSRDGSTVYIAAKVRWTHAPLLGRNLVEREVYGLRRHLFRRQLRNESL